MTNTKTKKRPSQTSTLVTSVRCGSIVADVHRGVTMDGHCYLYFIPARAWTPQSSTRENFSNRFYSRNKDDFKEAIDGASQWIDEHPEAADPAWTPGERDEDVIVRAA